MEARADSPLITQAVELIRLYGSTEAAEYASRIQAATAMNVCEFDYAGEAVTLSERLEKAREMLRDGVNGEKCVDSLAAVPDCAEKHYLMAIAQIRKTGHRPIPNVALNEIDRAMAMDQNNAVYKALAEMIQKDMSEDEDRLRQARSKQKGVVDRLARRIGI